VAEDLEDRVRRKSASGLTKTRGAARQGGPSHGLQTKGTASMSESSEKWGKEMRRVVERTATRMSREIDRMVTDLPEGAAPIMALELMVRELVQLQPDFMKRIMDHDFREAYEAAVAEQPATAQRSD